MQTMRMLEKYQRLLIDGFNHLYSFSEEGPVLTQVFTGQTVDAVKADFFLRNELVWNEIEGAYTAVFLANGEVRGLAEGAAMIVDLRNQKLVLSGETQIWILVFKADIFKPEWQCYCNRPVIMGIEERMILNRLSQPGISADLTESKLLYWFSRMLDQLGAPPQEHDYGSSARNDIRKLKAYIQDNLDRLTSVAEACRKLGLNFRIVRSQWKKYEPCSAGDYLTMLRMDEAKKLLLETNLPAREVAWLVGYASETSFMRAFAQATRFTTSEFRKRFTNKAPKN